MAAGRRSGTRDSQGLFALRPRCLVPPRPISQTPPRPSSALRSLALPSTGLPAGRRQRYAVGEFLGHDPTEYARRIAREERPYELSEVLGLEAGYLSPLVRDVMARAWIQSLADERGVSTLRGVYAAPARSAGDEEFARAAGASWTELERARQSFLQTPGECPPARRDEENGARLDLELQSACCEAVFEAFWNKPWFAGMYWWKWLTHGRGGPFDASHKPVGKPALELVRRWYSSAEEISRGGEPPALSRR